MNLSRCPRCREESYEQLGTHSHCFGCNYSPTFEAETEEVIPEWALRALGEGRTRPIGLQLAGGAA